MKRTKQWASVALAGLILCALNACDNSVKDVLGDYSYKISGTAVIDDTIPVLLTDEQGAMQIVSQKGKDVLLTMNIFMGGVYTADGKVSGDSLFIKQCTRTIPLTYTYESEEDSLISIEQTVTENFAIKVSGAGKVYNGTIHFLLTYDGEGDQSGRKIHGEKIVCVAKQN